MTTKSAAGSRTLYTSTWTGYRQSDGTSTGTGTARRYGLSQGSFSLTYADGPKYNNDGSPAWKDCVHTRGLHVSYSPFSYKAENSMVREYGELNTWFGGILPNAPSYMLSALPAYAPLPADGTTYQSHLNEIYGQVSPSMLGIENLASLFGGKSLFKTTETAIRALMRTAVNGRKASLKDAVKALMGMDLAKQFSVDATISDVESTVNLFEGWRTHIKKLRARQEAGVLLYKTSKSNTVTDQQQVAWDLSWTGLPTGGIPHNLVFNEERRVVSTTTCFTQAKVRYSSDTLSVINYLQGSLGLNRPLSSIWAIVPMSFLLDYVVSIQTLCDELDSTLNRNTAVQEMLQVGATWVTHKRSSMIRANLPPCACGGTGYTGSCQGATMVKEQSTFAREPLSLDSIYQGWSAVGSITPRKAATVAEIAFQIFA